MSQIIANSKGKDQNTHFRVGLSLIAAAAREPEAGTSEAAL